MDSAHFRRLGHAMVDWIADYRDNLARLPVRSQVAPGDIKARLPQAPPAQGGRIDEGHGRVTVRRGLSHAHVQHHQLSLCLHHRRRRPSHQR